MSEEERRAFLVERMKLASKHLSQEQLSTILSAPQAQNALFLVLLTSELVSYGHFESLDNKIKELTRAQTIDALLMAILDRLCKLTAAESVCVCVSERMCVRVCVCVSLSLSVTHTHTHTIMSHLHLLVPSFNGHPLPPSLQHTSIRLEATFSEHGDAVQTVLSSIAVSRTGMEAGELRSVCGMASPENGIAWSALQNALGFLLVERGSTLSFLHDYVKQAGACGVCV